jgi:2-polyprenyl-3-methyl-5-hydroxy-6-metoxy-1,4-benzoquinol methylase
MNNLSAERATSFGVEKLSLLDKFGVYLSKRAVKSHLPASSSLEMLDLGCGYHARLLRELLPNIRSGVGIDVKISGDARQTPGLSFIESTLEEALPKLEDERFDVVFLLSVIEHLHDPCKILKECLRVMKPDATLMVNVPTWKGKYFLELASFRLGLSGAFEIEDHKMYYDKRDLWPVLVKAGFRPSHIHLHYHKFGLNLFGVCSKTL